MIDKLLKYLSFFFFGFGVYMIYKEVAFVGVKGILESLKNLNPFLLLGGILLTGLNFLVLSGYDWLGLKYLKKKLPFLSVLKISAISFAVSNLAGHTYASGSALRYLFLKPYGWQKKNIFILVSFISLFSIFSLMAGFLLAFFIKLFFSVQIHFIHPFLFYIMGATCFLIFGIYFFKIVPNKRMLKIKSIQIKTPSFSQSINGLFIGLMDFLSLFFVFYLFLESNESFQILSIFPAFSFALVLAYLSQVPAGIGVFESFFLLLYPHEPTLKAPILTAFILFRIVYYIIPFMCACFYLGMKKLFKRKK